KRQRRLIPTRIELDLARVTMPFEGADGAVRGDQAQHRRDALAEPADVGAPRETPAGMVERVLDARVEHPLLPHHLHGGVERRAVDPRPRGLEALEGPIRRQREAEALE